MGGFVLALLLFAGFTLLGQLLRPKPRFGIPQPSSIGDHDLPTAEEGRPLPVVFGTCLVQGPNVTLAGGYRTESIASGHKYFADLEWTVCRGPGVLIDQVRFDGRPVTFNFPLTGSGLYTANSPTLFGAEQDEGGITGLFWIDNGDQAAANSYLQTRYGPNLPALKGVARVASLGAYLGTSPYLKPASFRVKGFPNSLGMQNNHHVVSGNDANPACMLYELFTDVEWAMKIPAAFMDVASFISAGETLWTEGLGMSVLLDTAIDAKDFKEEIERHIDGVVRWNPATGLFELKLARFDYLVGDLPIFDESNVETCSFKRADAAETRNVVKIRYIDRAADFQERVAQAQDLANVHARGGEVVSEEIRFRGLSNAATAQKVAARVLMGFSSSLGAVQFPASRAAYKLLPADPFVFRWGPLGIGQVVMRVTRLSSGTVQDGRITVDAVEDIFAVAWTAYGPPFPPGGEPPGALPQPLLAQGLLDACYGLIERTEALWILCFGARGPGTAVGYQAWSEATETFPASGPLLQTNDVRAFTASGRLTGSLKPSDSTIVVTADVDMTTLSNATAIELGAGKNLALIVNATMGSEELVAYRFIADNLNGTYTLSGITRGVGDTTPGAHGANARVFFFSAGAFALNRGLLAPSYPVSPVIRAAHARLLPYNAAGIVGLSDAGVVESAIQLTTDNSTTDQRAQRVFLPRSILLNVIAYPVVIVGVASLIWLHRNRLGAWGWDSGATATAEPNTVYRLTIYGELGTIVRTENALTGTFFSYNLPQEIADSGLGRPNRTLRFVLRSYDATRGFYSYAQFDLTVDCSGWGMLWGIYWGGVNGA